LSTHLRLGLPSGLFPSGMPTNILHAFLFFPPFVLHAPPISFHQVVYFSLICILTSLELLLLLLLLLLLWARQRSWLRHSVTSGKGAGSIPDEVTGFFQLT
jgi:hypothetical protein